MPSDIKLMDRVKISGRYGGPLFRGALSKGNLFLFDAAGRMAAAVFKDQRYYLLRHFGGKEVLYELHNPEKARDYGSLQYDSAPVICEDETLLRQFSAAARDNLAELISGLRVNHGRFAADFPHIDNIIEHSPEVLDSEAKLFDRIMGVRIDVLPPDLYREEYMVTPIIVAEGCGGSCTFCKFPSNRSFRQLPEESVDKMISELLTHFGRSIPYYRDVFLGDKRAFALPTGYLLRIIDKINSALGYKPDYFLFGTITDLNSKEPEELLEFAKAGCNLNIGLETGHDALLKETKKGHSAEEAKMAMAKARNAGLLFSVNFMPGLGGKPYFNEHPRATRQLLDEVDYRGIVYVAPYGQDGRALWEPLNAQEIDIQRKMIGDHNGYRFKVRQYAFVSLN